MHIQSKYGHLFKMKRLHVLLLQLNNRFRDLINLLRPTFYNLVGFYWSIYQDARQISNNLQYVHLISVYASTKKEYLKLNMNNFDNKQLCHSTQ